MDGFPRRSCLDSMTPAELAIRNAVLEVEAVGAHPRLTDAVILLAAARDAVADFVDGVTPPARPPMRLSIAFERDPENNRERPVIVDDRGARMPCVRGVQVMYDYDSASEVVIRLVVNGRDVMVGTPVEAPATSPADDDAVANQAPRRGPPDDHHAERAAFERFMRELAEQLPPVPREWFTDALDRYAVS